MQYDIIIVGAGITGITLAERFATQKGQKVLLMDKRNHIGGNCYDYYNRDGILVHKYGAHIFHTDSKKVWDYLSQYTDWNSYRHQVLSCVDNKLVPIPVNVETINSLFGLNLNEGGMWRGLMLRQIFNKHPQNSEEVALSRVGLALYQKMFKNYSFKQWGKDPRELSPEILARIPVHYSRENYYFDDRYQGIPSKGYTQLFEKMLQNSNIEIKLGVDYLKNRKILKNCGKLFYTGMIDRFFNYKFGKLEYRSLQFKWKTYQKKFYQQVGVINYPGLDKDYLRIVEYKHFTGQKSNKTTISKESVKEKGEPYYPVITNFNKKLYLKYEEEAKQLKNVYFIGRLGSYQYLNMDQAVLNALNLFKTVEKNDEKL